jgi:tetratricopeptide (TPR) repeat protein
MILGQVTKAGERLVATTELVNVEDGRVLSSSKAEGRTIEEIFTVAESLGQHARQALQRPTRAADETLASRLTDSVEAYRAYVRGESSFHRWEFQEAIEAFQEAVRIDPEFALAYYQLSVSLGWYGTEGWREAAETASRYADKLPPAYRNVVRAWASDSDEEKIRLLEAALVEDRQNKAALQAMSDIYIHNSKHLDLPRSVALMEDLMAIDPDFSLVYEHLALAHVLMGQTKRAREWLDRWEPKGLDQVRLPRAFLLAQERRFEEAIRVGLESSDAMAFEVYTGGAAILASRWDLARELIPPAEKYQEQLHIWRFHFRGINDAYQGSFASAEAAFPAGAVDPGVDYNLPGGASTAAAQSLAQLLSLKGETAGAQTEAERALAIHPDCPRCLYFAGLYALRNGKTSEGKKHLGRLKEVDAAGRSVVSDIYFDALQAEMHLATGKPGEARKLLERVVGSGKLLWDWYTTFSTSGAVFRDGLARTYMALGDKEKAVEALEALVESDWERVDHPVLYVRAFYTLGVLYSDLGDEAKSRDYFEQFLEHWGNADWDLPEIRDARARLKG